MGAGRVDPQKCARKRPRGAARVRAASLATQCTGELPRGGDGGPGCWVAARRNRCSRARGHRQYFVDTLKLPSEHSCRSLLLRRTGRISQTGVFGAGAPRVRRLVNLPPRPKNNSLRFRQAARPSPRRRRRRTQYCVLAPRATRGRSSHGVSRRTTPRLIVGGTT